MSVIPMVVEQTAHGERSFDIFSRLLNERIIVVGSAIDERLANLVVAQLIHLEAADPDRDIALYINSPGGDVYGGLAIYDTMQFVRRTCRRSASGSPCRWAPSSWPPARRASGWRCRTRR